MVENQKRKNYAVAAECAGIVEKATIDLSVHAGARVLVQDILTTLLLILSKDKEVYEKLKQEIIRKYNKKDANNTA